jgi:hypothetical protein
MRRCRTVGSQVSYTSADQNLLESTGSGPVCTARAVRAQRQGPHALRAARAVAPLSHGSCDLALTVRAPGSRAVAPGLARLRHGLALSGAAHGTFARPRGVPGCRAAAGRPRTPRLCQRRSSTWPRHWLWRSVQRGDALRRARTASQGSPNCGSTSATALALRTPRPQSRQPPPQSCPSPPRYSHRTYSACAARCGTSGVFARAAVDAHTATTRRREDAPMRLVRPAGQGTAFPP